MGRLSLSRRPGQTIRIGHDGEIEVTVVRVRGQSVDLVVVADASIPIDRQEVFAEKALPTAAPASRRPNSRRS